MADEKPWEKQEEESATAYQAFCAYYLLPADERSIDAAWRSGAKEGQNRIGKRAPSGWFAWSKKHEWVKRAGEYDQHIAEKNRLKWERRRAQLAESDWEQATKLRAVVDEAIPHARQFIRRQVNFIKGKDGKPDREIITLEFQLGNLVSAMERLSKLQRTAAGEPVEESSQIVESIHLQSNSIRYIREVRPPINDSGDDE